MCSCDRSRGGLPGRGRLCDRDLCVPLQCGDLWGSARHSAVRKARAAAGRALCWERWPVLACDVYGRGRSGALKNHPAPHDHRASHNQLITLHEPENRSLVWRQRPLLQPPPPSLTQHRRCSGSAGVVNGGDPATCEAALDPFPQWG